MRSAHVAHQIVHRLLRLDDEPVGDEAAMTPPRNGFRAKHGDCTTPPQREEPPRAPPELRGAHVIGIVTKSGIAEARPLLRIGRLRAPPCQLGNGLVVDACLLERAGKSSFAEMWERARPPQLADVGDDSDPVLRKEPHEFAQRPRGMPDRHESSDALQGRSLLRIVRRTVSYPRSR